MHFTLVLSIILALSLQCQVSVSMLPEEQAVRDATAASAHADEVQSSTHRAVSLSSSQRYDSSRGGSDDEEDEEEVEQLADHRFMDDGTHAPRQTISPGQKIKASWSRFSDRVSSFLSKLRKVIFFWRKSRPIPHFSDASYMMRQLEELLQHVEAFVQTGEAPKELTAKFATIVKGRKVKNPWKFYKQVTGENYVQYKAEEYRKLNYELITHLQNHFQLTRYAMDTYKQTQERLVKSVADFKGFLSARVDPNIDMEKLADNIRKYSSSLPVNDLTIAHQYQLTFLHMFGQGHITLPDVIDVDGTVRLDELSRVFQLKAAFGLKADQWDLSPEETEAIIKAFPQIEKALKNLYIVQDVTTYLKRNGQNTIPTHYQELKYNADVTLEREHGTLMRTFGTEEKAKSVFSKIYRSTLTEGPLADKKGSPLEYMLLPLLEPAGPGRSFETATNVEAKMKSMGIIGGMISQSEFIQKYYDIIALTTAALANHYRSAQGLRAVRNILEHSMMTMRRS
ncbi:uncharacterized protein MELLADRAFT_88049 [Melampsora larici-populina 98AG31]|uniref:Secreted protein n=1 Tax=Melampsora larici-populina (strain 98AG31 / pathotype 3-4-7) TaxID=747676 RepID=F4RQ90_MELLP|nr:uncharacterized protein MELLADRAFT_88049 [Melampsora larici-populina 98AG31]EGG05363.1 hypothetical protein MELLADRAFT_88049 [Melampsora larici-populina 98AG31]